VQHHRRTPNPRDEAGQTSAFLLKLAVLIAVVGFLAIDLGGPFITRIQVDHDAQDAMKDAAKVYDTSHYNLDATQARLESQLTGTGIVVKDVEVVPNPDAAAGAQYRHLLRATFEKDARTYLMGKIPQLKDWYHIEIHSESQVH